MRSRTIAAGLICVLVGAGCGSDNGPAAPTVERVEETAEKQPKLPRGYERYENRSAGVVFGRPPGWDVAEEGSLTVIRAPDELVVLSMAADRTTEALATPPGEFAAATAELLPGYREPLRPSEPKRFGHRYDAAKVEAKGVSRKGFRQRVRVIVLQREGVAVVTAIIAENAEEGAPAEVRQALVALRSLRTVPPA